MSEVLAEARFDRKLRTYLLLQNLGVMVSTVVGILAAPIWVPLAFRWSRRYWETLSCSLTPRSVVVGKGVVFRQETTIPLDRIQDVSIRYGPVLDWLGLSTIRIETAAMKSAGSTGINLTGVVDTAAFRDRILAQREAVAQGLEKGAAAARLDVAPAREASSSSRVEALPQADAAVLTDIRDTLRRIEAVLARE